MKKEAGKKVASVCVTLEGSDSAGATALAFGGAREALAGVPTADLVAELAARSGDTSVRVLDGTTYINATVEL